MKIYERATDLIGHTPLLRLSNIIKNMDLKLIYTQSLSISTLPEALRTESPRL